MKLEAGVLTGRAGWRASLCRAHVAAADLAANAGDLDRARTLYLRALAVDDEDVAAVSQMTAFVMLLGLCHCCGAHIGAAPCC